jgi:ubiquinone/menaquinone biosynthesis C-methylase UbiE
MSQPATQSSGCRLEPSAPHSVKSPVDPRDFQHVEGIDDVDALVDYLRDVAELDEMRSTNAFIEGMLDLQRGHRVLDVGCGIGDQVRRLSAAVGKTGHVVGIDAEPIVQAARRIGTPDNAEFLVGDAHNLPFDVSSFDRYRAHRVYMHLEDPRRALEEAVRVVAPGGAVVISEPDWGTLTIDADDDEVTRAILRAIQESIRHPWIGRTLPRLFREAGLSEVQTAPEFAPFPSYAVAHEFLIGSAIEEVKRLRRLPEPRVLAWAEQLQARDAAGSFFFGAVLVLVRGYVPGVRSSPPRRRRSAWRRSAPPKS